MKPIPRAEKNVLSVAEWALELPASPWTIRDWHHRHGLKAFRVGRKLMIARHDMAEFLDKHAKDPQ